MRELIDEVEDQCGDARLREMRRQTTQQIGAVGGREQLFVPHRHGLTDQFPELLGQQLRLMCVETLFVGRLAPPFRMASGNLHGKHAAEDRVAGERRRGRQDAVVVRFLDIEERCDEVAEHFPLIEPQTVDEDEHHAAGALQRRHEEFRADVH